MNKKLLITIMVIAIGAFLASSAMAEAWVIFHSVRQVQGPQQERF